MDEKESRRAANSAAATGRAGDCGQSLTSARQYSTNPWHAQERLQIRRADGREIGGIVDSTFRKHIVGSRHILRKPRAVAFDVSTLRDAETAGAVNVLVIDDETGAEYRASIAKIWARGFKVSRGFGEQIALLLSDFNKPDGPEHTPTPKPTQPALFNLSRLIR